MDESDSEEEPVSLEEMLKFPEAEALAPKVGQGDDLRHHSYPLSLYRSDIWHMDISHYV